MQDQPSAPPSILLVEDNRGDVELLHEAFRRSELAADLSVASDGDQAIQIIDQMERGERPLPKLVILDLNIPKKNGHEVLEYLRSTVRCRDLAVVVLTSSEAPVDQKSVAAKGVKQYMIKPSNLAAFMEIGSAIKAVLEPEA
jgi:CheY-like chemotaxis protein